MSGIEWLVAGVGLVLGWLVVSMLTGKRRPPKPGAPTARDDEAHRP